MFCIFEKTNQMKKQELAYLTTILINQQFELEEKTIKAILQSNKIELTEENFKKVEKKIIDDDYTEFILSYDKIDLGVIKHEIINDMRQIQVSFIPMSPLN